jgi:hypothetical protein
MNLNCLFFGKFITYKVVTQSTKECPLLLKIYLQDKLGRSRLVDGNFSYGWTPLLHYISLKINVPPAVRMTYKEEQNVQVAVI